MNDASAKEIEAWSTDATAGFANGQAEALAGHVPALALALECASLARACRQALEAEALMRGRVCR